MQTRAILCFFAFAFGAWTGADAAASGRVICGVDVSKSPRCYRELRRLEAACQATPTICGHTYKASQIPRVAVAMRRCQRLYRRHRARWRRGLCGIRLFSPPKTYCGMKGVEVAAACIKASQPKAPVVVGPAATRVVPRAATPRAATPPSAPNAQPRVAPTPPTVPTSVTPLSSKKRRTEPSPRVGTVRLTSPESSSTPTWMLLLQLLTLVMVLFLMFRRPSGRGRGKNWESHSWELDDVWERPREEKKQSADAELLLRMEERLESWEEQQREMRKRELSLPNQMQVEADGLIDYYHSLAQFLVQTAGKNSHEQTEIRARLLEARKRLHWLFKAHRELPGQADSIEQIKAASWHHMQRLLEKLGYAGWESKFKSHMTNGLFTAEEFLERKSQDQAERYLNGEELDSYQMLRKEFLSCLERLLRSNLSSLRRACCAPTKTLKPEAERSLFFREYVMGFLLEELPEMLQELARHSSPERSGALLDQFVQFIEEEIAASGVELFPVLAPEMTDTVNAKLIYLLHAGVRTTGTSSILLRRPDSSIMSVESHERPAGAAISQAPIHQTSTSSVPYSYDGGVESEQGAREISLGNAPQEDWLDAPEEDELFDFQLHPCEADFGEEGGSEDPRISHPDSDPPEMTVEEVRRSQPPTNVPTPLPKGPLPHFEQPDTSSAMPSSRKVTREYGPTGQPSLGK